MNNYIAVSQATATTATNNGAVCTPLSSVPCNDCLLGSPTPVSGAVCLFGSITAIQTTIVTPTNSGLSCPVTSSYIPCNNCTMGLFTTVGTCAHGFIGLTRTTLLAPVYGDKCPPTSSSEECVVPTSSKSVSSTIIISSSLPAPGRPVVGSNPSTYGSNPAPSPGPTPVVSDALKGCSQSLLALFIAAIAIII